ncbi:MAG: endoglucanase [Actinobacteria bacterium HGW-Actinobacteria-4]|nr:MAG: endoglucanase [Actinobacteria bacterium HGW-Actinobacteria-4]
MKNFANGVNLGGWLSQYQAYDHHHFRTFITEADIQQIASWGLDHVRLPVDYPVLESDDAIGVPLTSGYEYLDNCVAWCEAAGLALILDLHKAPSFSFNHDLEDDTKSLNTLFENQQAQDRFVGIWEELVRRYKDAPIPIIFELLNEVVIPDVAPWNALLQRTISAMRVLAPEVPIMIGGNNFNGAADMADLVLLDDPNVIYTFHYYHPMLFTHQKAPWSPAMREFDTDVTYPGEFTGLEEYLARDPKHFESLKGHLGRTAGRDHVLELLQPALDFQAATGREVYCGEFGAADWIDPASRQRWLADFLGMLREAGIGGAIWSYKQMDFGLVDAGGDVVDQQYLDILRGE